MRAGQCSVAGQLALPPVLRVEVFGALTHTATIAASVINPDVRNPATRTKFARPKKRVTALATVTGITGKKTY